MTPGERHAIRESVREAIALARDLARCSAAAQAIAAELASPLTTSAAGHMPNAGAPGCWPADAPTAITLALSSVIWKMAERLRPSITSRLAAPRPLQRSARHDVARSPTQRFRRPRFPARSTFAVVFNDSCPVQWTGKQAVETLPEHIDASNADQIREELLAHINRGAVTVIADVTATHSCDRAGADAVARACKRTAVSGIQLRLVVTAQI